MENSQREITLGKATLRVTLPSFAEREELVQAWHVASADEGNYMALRRVAAAAVGLCTTTGKRSRADYGASRCDPLVYGGRVYDYLHDQGVELGDVLRAGAELVTLCAEALFPREPEVASRADFTGPAGGAAT